MKAMYKNEIAAAAGVSVRTLSQYIKTLLNEKEFAEYKPKTRLLNPAQVKLIVDRYCIDLE